MLTEALIVELQRQQVRSITLFCPADQTDAFRENPGATVISWQPGKEAEIQAALDGIDILILNHALPSAPICDAATLNSTLATSLNSVVRLANSFLTTVQGNERIANWRWAP